MNQVQIIKELQNSTTNNNRRIAQLFSILFKEDPNWVPKEVVSISDFAEGELEGLDKTEIKQKVKQK